MPRQSRGRAAPSRPTAAPARPAVSTPTPQTRPASTTAHPSAQTTQQAPPQASQGPGLFGQMASTAAGVAVGSSIGHAIGGWFGSGSSAPTEQQQAAEQVQSSSYQTAAVCGVEVSSFRQCMDQNQGDLTICGWYLDQLKACQQAASKY